MENRLKNLKDGEGLFGKNGTKLNIRYRDSYVLILKTHPCNQSLKNGYI